MWTPLFPVNDLTFQGVAEWKAGWLHSTSFSAASVETREPAERMSCYAVCSTFIALADAAPVDHDQPRFPVHGQCRPAPPH